MSDAIGNAINIGDWYAHASRSAGYSTVVCGKALEVNDGKVVLGEVLRGRAPYNDDIKYIEDTKRKIVTLSENSVVPIGGHFIMWDRDDV